MLPALLGLWVWFLRGRRRERLIVAGVFVAWCVYGQAVMRESLRMCRPDVDPNAWPRPVLPPILGE